MIMIRIYKLLALLLLGLISLTTLAGCADKVVDTGLGEVTLYSIEQGYRTEGGGFQDKVVWAGTEKVATWKQTVRAKRVGYTPILVKLEKFTVPMKKMNNQPMEFWLYLNYMPIPTSMAKIEVGLLNHNDEIARLFKEAAFTVLNNLDMGYKEGDALATQSRGEFTDREKVSDKIFEELKSQFEAFYPQFKDDFFFIRVSLGNDELPEKVRLAYEETATERYKTVEEKYKQELQKIEDIILLKGTETDLKMYEKVMATIDDKVLNYRGNEIITDFMEDPNTETIFIFEYNKKGNLAIFDVDGNVTVNH